VIVEREGAVWEVNLRRPIVTNGDLVASLCGSAYRAIELSCGVVNEVGPGIHLLDGSPRASRGRGCFWHGFWHFSASAPAFVSMAENGSKMAAILNCKMATTRGVNRICWGFFPAPFE